MHGKSLNPDFLLQINMRGAEFHATCAPESLSLSNVYGRLEIPGWVVISFFLGGVTWLFGFGMVVWALGFSSQAPVIFAAGLALLAPAVIWVTIQIKRKRRTLSEPANEPVRTLSCEESLRCSRIRRVDEDSNYLVLFADDPRGTCAGRFSVAKNSLDAVFIYRIGGGGRVVLRSGAADYFFDAADQDHALASLKKLALNCGMRSYDVFRASEVMTEIRCTRSLTAAHSLAQDDETFEENELLANDAEPDRPPSHVFPDKTEDQFEIVVYDPSRLLLLRRPLAGFFTGFTVMLHILLGLWIFWMYREQEWGEIGVPLLFSAMLWVVWFYFASPREIRIEKSSGKLVKKIGPLRWKTIAFNHIRSLRIRTIRRVHSIGETSRRTYYECRLEILSDTGNDKLCSFAAGTEEDAFADISNLLHAVRGIVGWEVSWTETED